jgi:CHU_C Type IX secretion signal domain
MTRILRILALLLFVSNAILAQNPSDTPCNAPTIQANNTPGTLINQQISVCCNGYTNFLNSGPSCGTAQTNRDAWYKIQGMTAGEQYNFMYIETGNRQTWVEIFELPAGKNCAIAADYVSVKCARANNVAFYPGSTVSATFIPPNASSTYYARFQRLNVTDEALEGAFSITKSYVNEEPCGATLLQVQPAQGTAPTFGNNVTAADWKPEILTGPLCGPNNDVWYKFVATTCSMQIFVDNLSQTVYEMQAAILASSDGTCNNLMQVTPCGGQPDQYLDIMLTADNLTIGKTYYVIVDGYAPPYINAIGNFSIEVFEKPNGPACPKIASPCECDDALTCGGTVLPNSAAGNAALAAAANPTSNGCFNFAQNTPPAPALCGGNNTVEFCTKYTALSTDTLIAFDNVVHKDAACEVLSSKNIAYEEGICGAPINPVCLDYNKKSPVFKVTPGKTYRFCREVITNGADADCLGKTYQSFCAFLWKMPASSNLSQTICNGESFTLGGNTYTQSGNYAVLIPSPTTGCDSIVNVKLTVLPAVNATADKKICFGETLVFGTKTLTQSGTYTEKFKSIVNGCDSTVTLNLTVLPAKTVNIKKTICSGEKFTIGGKTYDQTGQYTISIKSIDGLNCDSTIILDLNVPTKIQQINKVTVCNGKTYTAPNGKVYDKTGKYDEVFKATGGCDSTYTIDLTVLNILSGVKDETVCPKQLPYIFGTQSITKEGTYTEVFKTKIGCDSTVTLKLQVRDTKDVIETKAACESFLWKVTGETYTKSGTYEKIVPSTDSCDQLFKLILTINKKPAVADINATICEGKTYTLFGKTYTQSTTAQVTGTANNGCDSIVNLNLKVTPKNTINETKTICNKDSVEVNGKYYKEKQVVGYGLTNSITGCRDTVIVSIEKADFNTNTTGTSVACTANPAVGTVTATGVGSGQYTYLWSNKATTSTVTGLPIGTYTVTVTDSKTGCKAEGTATVSQEKPTITATPAQSVVILGGSTTITVKPTPPNAAITVDPNTNVTKNSDGTYTIKVLDVESKTYIFTATDNGCTAKDTITVKGKLDIPLVFIPDGEGDVDKDDIIFRPVANDSTITYSKFVIFNRWSEVVYDNPKEAKWNGNYEGKASGNGGKKCPADVYHYLIQPAISEKPIKGQVTLLR